MYKIIGSRGIGKTDALMYKTQYLLDEDSSKTVAYFCAQPSVISKCYQGRGFRHADRVLFASYTEFYNVKADYKIIDELEQFLQANDVWAYSDSLNDCYLDKKE